LINIGYECAVLKFHTSKVGKLTDSLKDDGIDDGSMIINLNWATEHV